MSLFVVGVTLLDADGNNKQVDVKVPSGVLTKAEIELFAQYFAEKVDAASEAKVTGLRVTWELTPTGVIKPNPVAGSNVQEAALWTFDAAGTPYAYSVSFPAWLQAAFTGKEVNQIHGAAAALKTLMLDGYNAAGTMVIPSDKYENDLTSVISAVKRFRRK